MSTQPTSSTDRRTIDSGFSLVEVIIAAGILVVLASGIAPLIDRTLRAGSSSARDTLALALAVQKLEQLRGLTWGVALPGPHPPSDLETDLSIDPSGTGGPGLAPSPAGTLAANVSGYVDYLDGSGRWVGNAADPPVRAVYQRRWSVRQAPGSVADLLVLDVVVVVLPRVGLAPAEPGPTDPGVVWLTTLRGRR